MPQKTTSTGKLLKSKKENQNKTKQTNQNKTKRQSEIFNWSKKANKLDWHTVQMLRPCYPNLSFTTSSWKKKNLQALSFFFYHPTLLSFQTTESRNRKLCLVFKLTVYKLHSPFQIISSRLWLFFFSRAPWSRELLIICSCSAKQNASMKKPETQTGTPQRYAEINQQQTKHQCKKVEKTAKLGWRSFIWK